MVLWHLGQVENTAQGVAQCRVLCPVCLVPCAPLRACLIPGLCYPGQEGAGTPGGVTTFCLLTAKKAAQRTPRFHLRCFGQRLSLVGLRNSQFVFAKTGTA